MTDNDLYYQIYPCISIITSRQAHGFLTNRRDRYVGYHLICGLVRAIVTGKRLFWAILMDVLRLWIFLVYNIDMIICFLALESGSASALAPLAAKVYRMPELSSKDPNITLLHIHHIF